LSFKQSLAGNTASPLLRAIAIGLGIAVLVFVISGGHVLFLPLLFLPFGLFSFGHARRHRRWH
jgi:hypothetical protein